MYIFLWKANASLFKNTIYERASGLALSLIYFSFSTKFQARVLVKLFLKQNVYLNFLTHPIVWLQTALCVFTRGQQFWLLVSLLHFGIHPSAHFRMEPSVFLGMEHSLGREFRNITCFGEILFSSFLLTKRDGPYCSNSVMVKIFMSNEFTSEPFTYYVTLVLAFLETHSSLVTLFHKLKTTPQFV